jgi:hypothetical protein
MTTHQKSQIVAREGFGRERDSAAFPAALTIERFVRRNDRGFRRLLASLFGHVLDRQLAAGCSPESGQLRAARAERLVSTPERRRLLRDWEKVVDEAFTSPRARNPHAPVGRERIVDAMEDVRTMLAALSTPFPVSARGVAMASLMLSDGTGPLYNKACAVPLSTALRRVTAELDPAFPFQK